MSEPMSQNPMPAAKPSTSGTAIASLVLGIIAILMSWVPIVNNFSFILALIGVVLGVIGVIGIKRGKKSGKGIVIAALVLNILSFMIVIGTQSLYNQALDSALSTTEITSTTSDDVSADQENQESETAGQSSQNDDVPTEYKSALKSAARYSKTLHMSKQGIYDQLTSDFDKFSEEAAQYAIDNLDADYKANALAKAKSYQKTLSLSPEGIRSQLTSEYADKFTQEEADYAVANLD